MSMAVPSPRTLAGTTMLTVVPALGDDPDGQEVLDIAFALVRAGARVIVASAEGPLLAELQGFGGEWIECASERAGFWQWRRSRRTLEELVQSERVDLVHARGIGPTRLAATAAGDSAAWIVIGCGAEAVALDRAYARALLRADRVIAQSGYLADLIIDAQHVARDRVVVIPRPVDTKRFDPAAVSVERVAALRRAWRVERGERIVLVPGRLDPGKGQLVLIDAVRMLVSGGLRHVVFVLAGDESRRPDYVRAVAERAQAHGIGPFIRQAGICPDMPAAYAAADFVAVPAIVPPAFPRSAAEALAMGRPLVASAIGGLPELVLAPPRAPDSARTGWLVAPDDAGALAHGLAAAESLDLPALRALGTRARRLATLLFAPSRVMEATLGVYTDLLQGKS
jgi:glycosyltransferase involved in cell wall biosynthesis